MPTNLPDNTLPEERFRYLREHAGPQLEIIDAQIRDCKKRLDTNWHQIKSARKKRAPMKKLNQLHYERDTIIRELHTARKNRNELKQLIESNRKDREAASQIYIARCKYIYNSLNSVKY